MPLHIAYCEATLKVCSSTLLKASAECGIIAGPGHKHQAEFASSYAISALKCIADSELLPDDIRGQVQQVLELYETVSDPFLGMNLQSEAETAGQTTRRY
jgi:hypothetical protein